MADRPIIFSGPMIRALLDGRKTQTRRVLKPQPVEYDGMWMWEKGIRWGAVTDPTFPRIYEPGDRLWVREAWSHTGQGVWTIEDARRRINGHPTYRASELNHSGHWWPSIHMPREFSRLTLHVTGVKVERLQDISEADAIAEGMIPFHGGGFAAEADGRCFGKDARNAFRVLWDTLHGPDAWAANPWVVAITFGVVRANIDTAEAQAA